MDFSFVSWWMVLLAFGLGVVVTFVLIVDFAEREVPVTGPTRDFRNLAVPQTPMARLAEAVPVSAEPYGPGSIRVLAGTASPAGYTIKADERSMMYHTPDSPVFFRDAAEIWFTDEESAVRSGFTPWYSRVT